MRTKELFLGIIASFFFFSGCGGAQKKPTHEATGDIVAGHELLRKRDLDGALAEFQVALDQEPSPEAEFRVGCVRYLMGDKLAAKTAYETYLRQKPDAPKWDRDEVSAEIKLIEQNPSKDDKREHNSMAGRRLRAEYLLLQADEAIEKEEFDKAAMNFEAAAKVIPNTELWFEAALLSSKAGAYESARRQYRAFLTETKEGLDERLAYSVQAEIFRLDTMINGKKPSSGQSLADRVFQARENGEEFLDKASEAVEPMDEVFAEELEPEAETAEQEEEAPPLTAKQKKALEREAKREARRLKRERLKAERKAKAEEKERKRAQRRAEAKAKAEAKTEAKQESVGETTAGGGDSSPEASNGEEEVAEYGQATGKSGGGGSEPAKPAGPPSPGPQPSGADDAAKSAPGIEALLKYCESPSSAVRMKAVKELARNLDPRATTALEERLLKDTSVQVRIGAADALVSRNSVKSVPVLHRAIMNSSNSNERASLQRAVRMLTGTDRVKDVLPDVED